MHTTNFEGGNGRTGLPPDKGGRGGLLEFSFTNPLNPPCQGDVVLFGFQFCFISRITHNRINDCLSGSGVVEFDIEGSFFDIKGGIFDSWNVFEGHTDKFDAGFAVDSRETDKSFFHCC